MKSIKSLHITFAIFLLATLALIANAEETIEPAIQETQQSSSSAEIPLETAEKVLLADIAPGGSCSCNPAPASRGWTIDNETCSKCTSSASCSTAKCEFKHDEHGGLENVGCQWNSGGGDADGLPVEGGDDGSL